MCDRMESQSTVNADYGDRTTFRQIRNFTSYGHVQKHLAVVTYDKLRSTPSTAAVLFVPLVGVRTFKAFAQRVDGDDAPCFTGGRLHGPVAVRHLIALECTESYERPCSDLRAFRVWFSPFGFKFCFALVPGFINTPPKLKP